MAGTFSEQIASSSTAPTVQTRTQRIMSEERRQIAQTQQEEYDRQVAEAQAKQKAEDDKRAILQKQIDDYNQGRDIAKKGFAPFGMNKDVQRGYKDYIQDKNRAEERANNMQNLLKEKNEYYSERNIAPETKTITDLRKSIVEDFQNANPSEKVYLNKDGTINVIKSEKFGQYLTPEEYNKKLADLNRTNISNFTKANPTEKVYLNKDGSINLIESKKFGQYLSLEDYNKKVNEFNALQKTPERTKVQYLDISPDAISTKLPYETSGTMNSSPTTQFKGTSVGENKPSKISASISEILSSIKNFAPFYVTSSDEIASPKNFFTSLNKNPTEFILNPVGFGLDRAVHVDKRSETDVLLSDTFKTYQTELNNQAEQLRVANIKSSGILDAVQPKYQTEYQNRFENKYYDKIVAGELTFEQAQNQFKETKEAKAVLERMNQEIGKSRAELGISAINPLTSEGRREYGAFGLNLASGLIGLAPTSLGETAERGAELYALYGTYSFLKAYPSVSTAVSSAFLVKGTYDFASPISAPEKRIGGLFTAGISAGTLGYSIYKWARTPTLNRVAEIPKSSLTETQTRFADKGGMVNPDTEVTITDEFGKVTNVKYYSTQKLSEQIVEGYRTVVSTKGRELLGMNPIYSGSPYAEKGLTTIYETGFGNVIDRDLSGYQKAVKVLSERTDWSSSEINKALRFYQPKVIVADYNAKVMFITGDEIKNAVVRIQGSRVLTQPVFSVNEELGISTRGAPTIKELINGKGEFLGMTKNGEFLSVVDFSVEKTFLTKEGLMYQPLSLAGKTTKEYLQATLSSPRGFGELSASDLIDKYDLQRAGIYASKIYPYEQYLEDSVAILGRREEGVFVANAKTGKIFTSEGKTIVLKNDNIMKIFRDLREEGGYSLERFSVKEQLGAVKPLAEFTNKDVMDIVKLLKSNPVVAKSSSLPSSDVTVSDGGVVSISATKISELKSILSPPIASYKEEQIQIGNIFSGTKQGQIPLFAQVSEQKFMTKSDLKQINLQSTDLRQILSQLTGLDTAQSLKTVQAQAQSSRSALGQIQEPILDVPLQNINIFENPTPPSSIPSFFGGFGDIGFPMTKLKRKLRRQKSVEQLAFLPDFTARALGIEGESYSSNADLKKLLKQSFSGFEVRSGVSIGKRNKTKKFNEKDVMRSLGI